MWLLTFKTDSGPVRSASKIFSTRLEALARARKLGLYIADKTDDWQYVSGRGVLYGVQYNWSVELAA